MTRALAAVGQEGVPDLFNQAHFLVDRHVAEGHGDRIAYRFRDQRTTYEGLARQCNRAGNALKSLGVEMEQRVALLLPDSPELLHGYLGAMKTGAVPVPLNPLQSAEELAFCLSDSRATAVIVSQEHLGKVNKVRPGLPHLRSVIVVAEPGHSSPGTWELATN